MQAVLSTCLLFLFEYTLYLIETDVPSMCSPVTQFAVQYLHGRSGSPEITANQTASLVRHVISQNHEEIREGTAESRAPRRNVVGFGYG